jgi:hypothetical protein
MVSQQKIVLFLLMVFCCTLSFLNKKPKKIADVYQNIQTYSKKNKFTKFLHRVILSPIIQELKTGGKVTTASKC